MLTVVAGAKGAPGVTSTALVLTASWGRPVVLMEADPSGADLWMRGNAEGGGALAQKPNLLTFASGVRNGARGGQQLIGATQQLACGVEVIPGLTTPGQANGLTALWPAIARACSGGGQTGEVDVVVDAGRIHGTVATLPLLERADVIALVVRPGRESLIHTVELIRELSGNLKRGWHTVRLQPLMVTRKSHAVAHTRELDEVLSVKTGLSLLPAAYVAEDTAALQRLLGGERPYGRLGKTPLIRSAQQAVATITNAAPQRQAPQPQAAQQPMPAGGTP